MKQNLDVVAQGIAAIGPYIRFIAARRRDADEEAAQIQPKASAPSVPLWGSGSIAPLPVVTHTEEAEAEAVAKVPPAAPRATVFASHNGSEREVSPQVQKATVPEIRGHASPTGTTSVPSDTAPPSTSIPRLAAEKATPPSGLSEVPPASERPRMADAAETTALTEPTTVEEAWAQFEATWHLSQPEKLPGVVRESYAERDRAPNEFAQKMIGASLNGFLPEALEATVATLIQVDPHFQEADVLSRKPNHAPLFQIELQEADYHADDSTLPGEADRAALSGDQPF